MTKVLIAYSSRTGNTEKLARAIALGVEREGGEAVVKSAPDVTKDDLIAADGIIFGSPVYFGSPTAEMKDLIDRSVAARKKLRDKVGAAFTTSGHITGGKETTMMTILMAFLIHEMVIVGDPLETGGHYGAACKGAPTAEDEEAGALLGVRVCRVATKMKS
ncbi:MAG: flavodoxin [Deltaproteobacteria bacterium]|mgnify:CR=1 FL=1|nr:MAG: flavodoxin [Deltaproteobacteria bacterium]